jgi:hypothetical protein
VSSRSFVDAAWVSDGELRAVVVTDDEVSGVDGALLLSRAGRSEEPDVLAAATLEALAVAALAEVGTRSAEVIGDGVVADRLRSLVATGDPGHPPAAIVDTTGDPERIEAATRRLADLGVLVLTVPPSGPVALDMYPDVHVRGLEVVGVSVVPQMLEAVLANGSYRSILDTMRAVVEPNAGLPVAASWLELRGT